MKTTIDIPEEALAEAMRHAGATTKREAVLAAVNDFNRRRRMADLVRHLGTFSDDFPSHETAEKAELAEAGRRWKR